MKEILAKLVERIDLTEAEAEGAMRIIMDGGATSAQIASFMTALRMKGETVAEVTGAARVMRERAEPICVNDPQVVDTCGTGGDQSGTFNISTTTAFVVAGCGVTVAKHGNRAVSSQCGSADVLKALGVVIDLPPGRVEAIINEIGIGFLFAPLFHGAMKHAAAPRQETALRSIFNLLGPLTNPAGASIQVLGVFAPALTDLMARVLLNIGCRHCFVVHALDGLDELSPAGLNQVSEGKEGRVATYRLSAKDFGLPDGERSDYVGGSAEDNAQIIRAILKAERGPKRDIVLMNAAPALVAAGKADTLAEGVRRAAASIDSGAADQKLDRLREQTNKAFR
jgi:anthranilate phosphoribosyltransferase